MYYSVTISVQLIISHRRAPSFRESWIRHWNHFIHQQVFNFTNLDFGCDCAVSPVSPPNPCSDFGPGWDCGSDFVAALPCGAVAPCCGPSPDCDPSSVYPAGCGLSADCGPAVGWHGAPGGRGWCDGCSGRGVGTLGPVRHTRDTPGTRHTSRWWTPRAECTPQCTRSECDRSECTRSECTRSEGTRSAHDLLSPAPSAPGPPAAGNQLCPRTWCHMIHTLG